MVKCGVLAADTRTSLPRMAAIGDPLLFEIKLVRAHDLKSVEAAYTVEKIRERLDNSKRISGLQRVVRSLATQVNVTYLKSGLQELLKIDREQLWD